MALETSAKESQNIEEAFVMMARELLAQNGLAVKEEDSQVTSPRILLRSSSRPINTPTPPPEKKGCEC